MPLLQAPRSATVEPASRSAGKIFVLCETGRFISVWTGRYSTSTKDDPFEWSVFVVLSHQLFSSTIVPMRAIGPSHHLHFSLCILECLGSNMAVDCSGK
jgi:hypothetical protein